MGDTENSLAVELGHRQHRLNYWKSQMSTAEFSEEQAHRFAELYSTYALLLAKITKSAGERELEESRERTINIERELTNLFEDRRLMTSRIGFPAIRT